MLQIVIPAFNEELRLGRTLRELRSQVSEGRSAFGPIEVLVVDNASTDRTADVARELDSPAMPVRVLTCATRGKGAAVRAGVLATDAEHVVFMDADGATDLAAIAEAARLLATGTQVAIASRAIAGSVTEVRHSWLRERGAGAYRSLTGRLVPGVSDTQCGFKAFRGDVARRVFADLRTTGFSFDVELLARCQLAGLDVVEFAAIWTDVPGSSFSPARHGLRSFGDLAAIAWRLRGARAARQTVIAFPAAQPGPALANPVLGAAMTNAEV